MRGQMALEFFFAMALVYLSVLWLLDYLNAGYDSGSYLGLREEKLVAADIAGIANSVCISNLSVTINAPCMANAGTPRGYWLYSKGNWVVVNSSRAAGAAKARALCGIQANLTAYNATTGAFEMQRMACDKDTAEGTQICIRATGNWTANIGMGRCTA